MAIWLRAALVELDSISDFSSALILGLDSWPGVVYTVLATVGLIQTLAQFVLFNLHGNSTPAVRALRMGSTVVLDLPMTAIDVRAVVLQSNPASQSYLIFSFLIKGATMAVHAALTWHELGTWLQQAQQPYLDREEEPPSCLWLAGRDVGASIAWFCSACCRGCCSSIACCRCCSCCGAGRGGSPHPARVGA